MAFSSASLSYPLICLVVILGVLRPAICYQPPSLPSGYEFDPTLNVAFKLHTEGKTWSEAKRTCESEGAILALVDNMAQIQYLAPKKGGAYVWVGMYRTSSTTSWTKVNGWNILSIPWAPTKPWGPHNCMAIRGCNRGLTNEDCNSRLGFVCEMARGTIIIS